MGWWVVLALLLTLLWLGVRSYRARRPQRAALKALRRIQQSGEPMAAQLTQLNQLLKRYLLSNGQQQATTLSGEAWLQFLDQHSGQRGFLDTPGQLLLTAPYLGSNIEPEHEAVTTLFRLSHHWIRRNTRRRFLFQ